MTGTVKKQTRVLDSTAKKIERVNTLSSIAMAGLPVLGFLLFGLIPLAISLYLGFCELHTIALSPAPKWVWFDNFGRLFRDQEFLISIKNTLLSLISLPLSMVIGFLIAYLLTQNDVKCKTLFRALFFLPYITSAVAVTYVFKSMFDTSFGIFNTIFHAGINIATQKFSFMLMVIVIMVWTSTGYYIILYQAALTGVNQSTLEAADIDGASQFRKIMKIIIPAVSPTTFYMLVMGIIGGLQNFAWFQIICNPLRTGGFGTYGPDNIGLTMVYYLYNKVFASSIGGTVDIGLASAAAIVVSLAILALTIFNFTMSNKWVHYE